MIDNHRMEVAYAVLVFVAWVWAISQIRAAGRRPFWSWSHTTALWLTAKASFFTIVGSIWWFNWFREPVLEWAVYTLAAVHVVAFVHWLLLPVADATPVVEKDGLP